MTHPVRIEATIEPIVVLIDEERAAYLDDIENQAIALHGARIDNREQHAEFNRIVAMGTAAERQIEADRVRAKAAPWKLCVDIDTAAKDRTTLLKNALHPLAIEMVRFERAERAEAERVERERQAQVREAQRRQLEAQSLPVATAADLRAREDLVDEMAVVELVEAPAPIKSSVSTRPKFVVVIDDIKLLPAVVNGIEVVEPKRAAIKKLLEANVPVPGCRLQAEETVVRRAR